VSTATAYLIGEPAVNPEKWGCGEMNHATPPNTVAGQIGPKQRRGPFLAMPKAALTSPAWRKLTAAQKDCYLAIASFADAEWRAWPSLATIARVAGVTERCTSKSVARLVEVGLLQRQSGGGRGRSNTYRMVADPPPGNPERTCSRFTGPETLNAKALNPEQRDINPEQACSGEQHNRTEKTTARNADAVDVPDSDQETDALKATIRAAGVQGRNAGRCADQLLKLTTALVAMSFVRNLVKRAAAARNPGGFIVDAILNNPDLPHDLTELEDQLQADRHRRQQLEQDQADRQRQQQQAEQDRQEHEDRQAQAKQQLEAMTRQEQLELRRLVLDQVNDATRNLLARKDPVKHPGLRPLVLQFMLEHNGTLADALLRTGKARKEVH